MKPPTSRTMIIGFSCHISLTKLEKSESIPFAVIYTTPFEKQSGARAKDGRDGYC